ncbi:MAG TPA: UTP--glucose-1-phosphate uridylyltransferase [Chloroflexota bacterium]|nr:UTP--glucose-1-phosphate uridylyltransferase [Chloroflexota bacterium]
MRVRKAVIPAAGFGTRFLPVTKSVPKAMLPIVARPVIQYVVEEAVASGIEQIIMVTGENREPLEAYFDRNVALEATLRQTGKQALLDEVIRIADLANIAYVTQKEPLGNGHAVLMARYVVGDEPFAVLWGDDILISRPPVAQQLIEVAERYAAPVIGVRRVPPDDFEKYGMVEVKDRDGRMGRAVSVVEKPRRDDSPSDLAQIGGFVLTPDVFDILAETPVGPSGEIYLADALITLMQRRTVYTYEFSGRRYDAGNKLDFLRATVDMALADPELGPTFREFLTEVVRREGAVAG